MIPRLMNYFFAALFFVILIQNANAQEMVFHMIGNQTAKYSISQLDSVTFSTQEMVLYLNDNQIAEYSSLQLDSISFIEGDSSIGDGSTDPSITNDAIDVTNKSATLVGYATNIRENFSTDLRVGFIYCLEGTPSKNNGIQVDVSTESVAEDGRYVAILNNLMPNTVYYFRSFVYQSGLWFYGKVKSFMTQNTEINFNTGDATSLTCFSAKLSGNVVVRSPYTTLEYGICYSTRIAPTIHDKKVNATVESFTLQLRQLLGGTIYYYRTYAIVDGYVYYGTVRTFRTLDDNVVETGTIDEETCVVTSRLTIGGGAYSSLVLGVCYGATELPTISNETVTSNEVDEENRYSVQLSNIDDGVVYYRSFVLIDGIPHYGAVRKIVRGFFDEGVFDSTNKVMQDAIYAGYKGRPEFMNGLNYYAYLKAMQSKFTLLLPSDSALFYYYDPASMKSRTPRAVEFYHVGGNFPVKMRFRNYYCPYNAGSNEIGSIGSIIPGAKYTNDEVTNRLKDILESHTIVHDGTNPMTRDDQKYYGIDPSTPLDEYYLSKNGNAIKVVRDENDSVIAIKGGFQLENERQGVVSENPGVLSCKLTKTRNVDNGHTYVLNAPMVPTYRSVYSIFTNDYDLNKENAGETPYSEFYELCTADGYETEIIGCGLVDGNLTKTQRESALKKFKIFVSDNGLDYNVQFFNNYRYTVFVPTNDAVREAIAAGLPTWEEIREDFRSHCKPEMEEVENEDGTTEWVVKLDPDGEIVYTDSLQTTEDSIRIAAKITYLTNFVRYHFADNSIFADKTEVKPNEMVTSSYDKELELFRKLHVDRIRNGEGTELRVCDDVTWKKNGNNMGANPFVTVGEKNVLARDISCNKSPRGVQMMGITINASSAAVIHSIPGYLNHTEVIDGDHTKTWENTIKAKAYLQRYAIR